MSFYNELTVGKQIPLVENYSKDLQKIDFWRASYDCTSEYLDGKDATGNSILMRYRCEAPEEYRYRKANTKPRNHVGGIIKKQNGFVFKNRIERSEDDPDYTEFLKSVDLAGNSINYFMQKSLLDAQIDGWTAIVVDHTSRVPGVKTLQQSKADGDRYFLRLVKRESVVNYSINDGILTECLIGYIDASGLPFYRYYDNLIVQDFYVNKNDTVEYALDPMEHGYADIPVVFHIPFPSQKESQVSSLAELQQGLTQALSMMAIEMANSIYTLHVFTGTLSNSHLDENGKPRNVTFGSGRILYVGDTGSIDRLGADTNAATTIQTQIEKTEEAIYRVAGIAAATPFKSGPAQSGLSKLYDMNDLASILASLSRSTQQAENKVMDILFKTMKGLNPNDSNYDLNYDIPNYLNELSELKETLAVDIPEIVKKKAVTSFVERNYDLSEEERLEFQNELYNNEDEEVVEEE